MENNPYSDLINQLQGIKPQDPQFGRRLNELISINELLTTLNTARTLEETLDIILLTILGEYACHKGAIYIKTNDAWRLGISKGIRHQDLDLRELPLDRQWDSLPTIVHITSRIPPGMELFDPLFQIIIPVKNESKLVGLICLGRSMLLMTGSDKEPLLTTIADFGGVLIGNHLYRGDLEQVNKQLQRQIFQLHTLYEISGSFARCLERDEVFHVLANNLMGQFFISRCAVLAFQETYRVIFQKGIKVGDKELRADRDIVPLEDWAEKVLHVEEAPNCGVRRFMEANRLRYILTIIGEGKSEGLLLLGNRLDRQVLSEADGDFVLSLAQQSAAALDNIRLQKEAAEKKRMEKELRLAREIQQQLLPKGVPSIKGYELAVEMRPYYQVGGDFYDFFSLENGKLTICLADVSGKSLPASMIMSTAQASLRALNSFDDRTPKEIIEKLNLHMWQSTQSNKFITMFYAVLDSVTHRLTYINAGHNRPILVKPDKSTVLLDKGGMVIGMFPKASYQVGNVDFEEGTELLIYTDGLSEVVAPGGEEYGDERLISSLVTKQGQGTVEDEKNEIVNEVMKFSSNEMVDDLTLLLIRRRK